MSQEEQRILDFVNGKMSAENRQKFEAEIKTNNSLKKEVIFYQDIAKTTQKMEDDELRRLLSETDQELAGEGFFEATPQHMPTTKSRQLKPFRTVLAIAASLALLLVTGWWYASSNFSNQALANRYFDAQVTQRIVRSSIETKGTLTAGLQSLSAENTDDAIAFFLSVPDSSGHYLEARLYLALAHYQSKDFQAANDAANEVSQSDSRFRQKARWLQLNALLSMDESGTSFLLLLDDALIDDTDPYYQKKAEELAEELNSFWRKLTD